MTPRDAFLILVICLVWASNFLAAAASLRHFPPFLFTTLRFGLVLLVVFPFLKPPSRDQWPRLVAVCLLMGTLHFSTNFMALARAQDISSIALLLQTYVPFSVLLAIPLLGERIGWRTAVAIGIAFGGVLLIGFDPLALRQLDAVALALVSAGCLALGSVLMRNLRGINPFRMQAWTAALSIPPLLAMSLALESPDKAMLVNASLTDWGGVIYSALGASIVGHGLYFWLVQRRGIAEVTPYLLLTPLFAVLLGITVWGDEPGWRVLAGGGCILGGILVISVRAKLRWRRPPPPRDAQ